MEKIIIPNSFTSVRKENGEFIQYSSMKLLGYLFTNWKMKEFPWVYLPSIREMAKETGMDHKTVMKSLEEIKSVNVVDNHGDECQLLVVDQKKYRVAFPGYGYTESENFKKGDNGGEATIGGIGGYFTITKEIQALNLPAGQELVFAAMDNIIHSPKYANKPNFIFNTRMFEKYGIFDGMKTERIRNIIRALKEKGLFNANVVRDRKYYGWKNIDLVKKENDPYEFLDDWTEEKSDDLYEYISETVQEDDPYEYIDDEFFDEFEEYLEEDFFDYLEERTKGADISFGEYLEKKLGKMKLGNTEITMSKKELYSSFSSDSEMTKEQLYDAIDDDILDAI